MKFNNTQLLIAIALIAVILAATLLAGCTSNTGTGNQTTATATPAPTAAAKQYVTLRWLATTGSVTLIDIADAKGFFDEQGLKVNTVGTVNGGTQSVQGVLAGQADIAGSAWAPYINANANSAGTKLKVVVAGQGQNQNETGILWLVHNNSSIHSAKDLVGKKIAVNVLGAEADYVTRQYLAQNGVPLDQVQLVVVPWPQHEQVFKSNQVDVVAVNSPFSQIILNDTDARILFTNYDQRGETALFVYGFKDDYIKQNPETVKKFSTAIAKAADWSVAHPAEARQLVGDIYAKQGGNRSLANYWTPSQAWPHALIKDNDVQWWLDTLAKNGTLKGGPYKPTDFYTDEFNPYNNT